MPLTMTALAVLGASLVGVPGTVGFVSKWYLILAAIEQGWWWLAGLIVASSLITIAYVGRVLEAAWFREPGKAVADMRDPPLGLLVPIWLLAGATIVFGVDANFVAGVAGEAAAVLLKGLS
jgi:multicomponent Na+:H+ antiporter subunit D